MDKKLEIDKDDLLLTMEEFINACKQMCFINYDGYGYYSNGKVMWRKIVLPSDVFDGNLDKSYSHIVWFNR